MAKSKAKPAAKSKKTPAAKVKAKTKPVAKAASKPKPKAAVKTKAKAKPVVKAKPSAKAKALAAKPKASPAKAAPTPRAAKASKLEDISAIFAPLDDRIIVEAVQAATRTPGGLYIPDTVDAGDRPQQGKVLAVGRGHQTKKGKIQPMDVQLGDTVLFEPYMGSPLRIGSRECVVLRESQILGIVRT